MLGPMDLSNAELFTWGRDCEGWKFLERPDLSINYERIPPARGEIQHYHRNSISSFPVKVLLSSEKINNWYVPAKDWKSPQGCSTAFGMMG